MSKVAASPLPPIYLISDRTLLAEERLQPTIEQLLQAGLGMLQLREKDLSAALLFPLALELRRLTSKYQCRLLINDRVDIAQAVEADGVHLGGHSLPTETVRKLLGPEKLIGVSTHSLPQVAAAMAAGADFVTFGPVFYTPSKAVYGSPVGLEKLAEACRKYPIPIYGLGGIKPENAAAVSSAGASGVAVISALLAAENPAEAFHSLNSTRSC